MKIPKSHPRYGSLRLRHMLVDGLKAGFVAESGLIAHGRGEAFDYLLGERTVAAALEAERAAVAAILLSNKPVVSVNGNTAALVPKEIVRFSEATGAGIEVNLFYRTPEREKLIAEVLKKAGATAVLGVDRGMKRIPGLESERARADPKGIWVADTVLIPLEDGDRAEALKNAGKRIISIDLNPLSRTSSVADIPIVDNVVRAFPNMIKFAEEMRSWNKERLKDALSRFDKASCLKEVISLIREGF